MFIVMFNCLSVFLNKISSNIVIEFYIFLWKLDMFWMMIFLLFLFYDYILRFIIREVGSNIICSFVKVFEM